MKNKRQRCIVFVIVIQLHAVDNQSQTVSTSTTTTVTIEHAEPQSKKFKFLEAKQRATNPSRTQADSAQAELNKYLIEVRNATVPFPNPIDFWIQRRPVYPLLATLAEDLVSAPASQAYVEGIFSVCGLLTAGRRNRMLKSLEMRVFLKLNAHILH